MNLLFLNSFKAEDHVEIIGSMESDARIVNAARVSFVKQIDKTKPLTEHDIRLIKYMLTKLKLKMKSITKNQAAMVHFTSDI